SVFQIDAAAIGAPAGDFGGPAFAEHAIHGRHTGIEALHRLVAGRVRRRVAVFPELAEERPLPFHSETAVTPALVGFHQIDERAVQAVEFGFAGGSERRVLLRNEHGGNEREGEPPDFHRHQNTEPRGWFPGLMMPRAYSRRIILLPDGYAGCVAD